MDGNLGHIRLVVQVRCIYDTYPSKRFVVEVLQFYFSFRLDASVTTPLGGFGGNANLGFPGQNGGQSSLLSTAVIGLGVLSLINTVATVVVPYFTKDEKPAETTEEEGGKFSV